MIPETPIPFEAFMRRALHHPRLGYYSRRISAVGRRGDFTTAPMLSAAPARTIARWATAALRETRTRHLIEIGPGEGTLAAAVINHLPLVLRLRVRLHLVETSAPLTARQKALLGNRATWHTSPEAALAACDGRAVIYSNELVDAFPVRRFRNTADGWKELAVSKAPDGVIRESLMETDRLPNSSSLSASHPDGQTVEVHQSYHRWLDSWLPHWQAGRMLTIDYGARADSLYHRRPNGTVRAYLLQQRLEGPDIYQNPGRQDLTADVNFTDLLQHGESRFTDQTLRTFATFLGPGAPTELTDPLGPGNAFLVLDQSRNL